MTSSTGLPRVDDEETEEEQDQVLHHSLLLLLVKEYAGGLRVSLKAGELASVLRASESYHGAGVVRLVTQQSCQEK